MGSVIVLINIKAIIINVYKKFSKTLKNKSVNPELHNASEV